MAKVEFVVCPTCKQKLAVQPYVTVGTNIVCANPKCNTSLRIEQRSPIKFKVVPNHETFNPGNRPESYA